VRKFILVLFVCQLVACVTPPTAPQPEVFDRGALAKTPQLSDRHLELIVADLVSALVQVQEFPPLSTTLQVSEPRGVYGAKLVETLETVGYGLQYVNADEGMNYLSYANRAIESNAGFVQDFTVRVGEVEFTREYKIVDERVLPTTVMFVKGVRSFDNIVLNADIFLHQGGELDFNNGVEVELADTSIMASEVTPVSQLPEQQGDPLELVAALVSARNYNSDETENVLLKERGSYRPVQQATITFPDDTLQLGRKNKSLIKTVMSSFDTTQDAIFVSACVNEAPDTEETATKRAIRVEEEFLIHGLPRSVVAREGCVAGAYPAGEIMPRTVMVMHRRKIDGARTVEVAEPDAFPSKPLVMTIPYGAGGATDFQARIVTMVASEKNMLGQPITIVNKPGDGGRAGWTWFVDTAVETGYDVATYNVPHFIAQSIKFGTPYNIDTLEPLGNWGADPAVLVVPNNSPFDDLRDFLLFAKNNPGKLSVSGAGLYVGHHIALLQLEKATNVELDYAPAKGGASALQQVVSGEVMAGFNNMSDVYRLGGKVRVLAIADLNRSDIMPDVPTFKELVVDVDDSSVNFRGLMLPKGAPKDVVEKLSSAALRMFNSPLVTARMNEGGAPLRIMSREEVLAMWNERQRYLTELLKGL